MFNILELFLGTGSAHKALWVQGDHQDQLALGDHCGQGNQGFHALLGTPDGRADQDYRGRQGGLGTQVCLGDLFVPVDQVVLELVWLLLGDRVHLFDQVDQVAQVCQEVPVVLEVQGGCQDLRDQGLRVGQAVP